MCRLGRALRSGDEDEGSGEEGGGGRRQRKKHGGGMKNRVDKPRGIETRITEALTKVSPTDSFACVVCLHSDTSSICQSSFNHLFHSFHKIKIKLHFFITAIIHRMMITA
jgi:hypothetical protein